MKPFSIGIVFCFCCGCDYFTPDVKPNPIARVNESYLYSEDVAGLISENTTAEDSAMIVNNYITRWATQQLLIDQAKKNLQPDQLEEYDKLVREYRNDLLTEAYKNVIVGEQLDSLITETEFREYYENHKENFKLNDVLLQVRYVQLPLDYSGLDTVKEKFSRFNEEDKMDLSSQEFKFKSYNFNDSIWVQKEALLNVLPIIRDNEAAVLKKSAFTQLQDSLGVYLVKIENIASPNEIAPLPYIKPTIKQILLNQRKLSLIKELEKDITKDAIKSNNFEIFSAN